MLRVMEPDHSPFNALTSSSATAEATPRRPRAVTPTDPARRAPPRLPPRPGTGRRWPAPPPPPPRARIGTNPVIAVARPGTNPALPAARVGTNPALPVARPVTDPERPAGLANRRLGPFTLERELGRGAYGVVYLGRRDGDQGHFAVKILLDHRQDGQSIARFRLESMIGRKIQDPGVIPVVETGQHGEIAYYAMEFVEGQTLHEIIYRQGQLGTPLPWKQAAEIVAALARTTATAHGVGVIHRDLKPGNVIVEATTGRPRITDFGLARDRSLVGSMTQTGDVIGTPVYMAPEQLRGEREIDHRVDIYALGAILYQCLTGRMPHDAPDLTLVELQERVARYDPPAPSQLVPTVPIGLERICMRALSKVRGDRHPEASLLADELEAWLHDPEAADRRARRSTGPRVVAGDAAGIAPRRAAPRWPIVVTGLLIAFALAGGVALLVRHGRATGRADALVAALRDVDGGLENAAGSLVDAQAALGRAERLLPEAPHLRTAVRSAEARVRGWAALADALAILDAEPDADLGPVEGHIDAARGGAGEDAALADAVAAASRRLAARRALHEFEATVGIEAATNQLARAHELAGEQPDAALATRLAAADARLLGRKRLETARFLAREAEPFPRVRETYQEAIAGMAGNADLQAAATAELADRCRRRGRYGEAVVIAEELTARTDRIGLEARFTRAFALVRIDGRIEEGLAELEKLFADDPDGVVGLTAGASRRLFGRGSSVRGDPIALARRALEIEPRSVHAMVTLGHALFGSGEREEAVRILDEARQIAPDDARVHYYLGRVYLETNRPHRAFRAYDRTVRLTEPNPFTMALDYRIESAFAAGSREHVVRDLDRLLERRPADALARFRRGLVALEEGRPADAESDWFRVREVDPEGFDLLIGRLPRELRAGARMLLDDADRER